MLNRGPPCNLSCPSWTGCGVTHQAIKSGVHRSTPLSNESGIYDTGLEQALKIQVSYMRKWPICPRPLFLPHYLLSPSLHLLLHGEFPTISWLSTNWAWFTGSAQNAGTIPKLKATALQLPSGTSLKDIDEGKYSQWAELQAGHLVVHFARKGKWPVSI